MTRIIRAPGAVPPRRRQAPGETRVLRASELRALREAEEIIRAAREQGRVLLERAEVEAAELVARAEAESRTRAAALLCRAEQRASQLALDARQELTELAVRIAEKILGAELRLDPDAVRSVVLQCLRALPGSRQVRLRVNPEDLPRLERALPQLGAASAAALELRADPQVAPGGCRLESELGEVDGRLEVQLARLAEALGTAPDDRGIK